MCLSVGLYVRRSDKVKFKTREEGWHKTKHVIRTVFLYPEKNGVVETHDLCCCPVLRNLCKHA